MGFAGSNMRRCTGSVELHPGDGSEPEWDCGDRAGVSGNKTRYCGCNRCACGTKCTQAKPYDSDYGHGIHPGSGVGNHRNGLTEENLQVKVIGIGVPTVVDAATIVHDSMAHLLDALEETEQKEFLDEMIAPNLYSMFVTPKDVMKL